MEEIRDERLKTKRRYCLVKEKMVEFYYCVYECEEECKNPDGKLMGIDKPKTHGIVFK